MCFVSALADSSLDLATLDMSAIFRHIGTLSSAALPAVHPALVKASAEAPKSRHECREYALQSVDSNIRTALLRSDPLLPDLIDEPKARELLRQAPSRVALEHPQVQPRLFFSQRRYPPPVASARRPTPSAPSKKVGASQPQHSQSQAPKESSRFTRPPSSQSHPRTSNQ